MIWNVRDAYIEARDKYFAPRAGDPELQGSDQALCGEAGNACDRAINALGGDDLWPAGQRQARFADCIDKVHALRTVDETHHFDDPSWLYDGLDLFSTAAKASWQALATFSISVEPLP